MVIDRRPAVAHDRVFLTSTTSTHQLPILLYPKMPMYLLKNASKRKNKKYALVPGWPQPSKSDKRPTPQPCYTVEPPQEFDEKEKELGPDAQVWKTYVKEADPVDKELVDGWNESMDVNLSNLRAQRS
ncbi:unnamed protein product [Rhizoctonia solani]|uniref:Uncharacterized protein n=1 Tax=Rhizoctonia solani TaxID=456999 RepID=A0A8H3AXL6_9AGAM|nr:unnamed protein product [Rhizoctonia solani]